MCAFTNCAALAGVTTVLGAKMLRYLSRALTVLAASSRRLSLSDTHWTIMERLFLGLHRVKRPRRDDRAVAQRLTPSSRLHADVTRTHPGNARAHLVRNWQRVVRVWRRDGTLTAGSRAAHQAPGTGARLTFTRYRLIMRTRCKDQRAASCVMPILDALWLPSPAQRHGHAPPRAESRAPKGRSWCHGWRHSRSCVATGCPIGAASARAHIRVARRAQSLLHILLSQSTELDATRILQVLLNRLATAPTRMRAGVTASTMDETAVARLDFMRARARPLRWPMRRHSSHLARASHCS